jgi:hypothetical protein
MWIETARRCAADSDVDALISLRCVEARALAQRDRLPDALDLARSAVALAETTDAPNRRAHALLDLASVLDACGAHGEADANRSAALTLYEAKENVVAAEAVRRAHALPPSARSPST